MKATEAVRSALTHQRKGRKTSVPHARFCPIRYDARSYRVKWGTAVCSLASVQGRLQIAFSLPAFARKYIGGKVASADLVYRRGRWRLHVSIGVTAPQIVATSDVVGVDLGVVRPAVTSNNRFLGQRRWREQQARIFRLRRKLQAKGTRSAKRHLRRLSGKLFRQRRDHDHVLSKGIVEATGAGGTIVLEDLTGIRSRVKQQHGQQSRRLHSWSFAQLRQFTGYKAEELGQRVVLVDPRRSSQRCSRCGHTAKANRRSQGVFCCQGCSLRLNADLNAARNLVAKYLSTNLPASARPLLAGSLSSCLSSRTHVVQGQAPPFRAGVT